MENPFDPVQRLRVARIMRSKAPKTSNPRWKAELNLMASQNERCRQENPITGFKDDACKCRMCPAYMTSKHAKPATKRLRAQFESVHPDRLFFGRLTFHAGKVKGNELRDARRALLYALVRLTQSRVWRDSFLCWGGAVHLEWTPASKKHGAAGFNVHVHLICEADEAPDIDAIKALWMRIVGEPTASPSDFFYFKKVNRLRCSATYAPHVRNLVPGLKEDHRGRLMLDRMPVRDIFAFLDATKGTHRLLRHGFSSLPGQRVQAKVSRRGAL